MKLITKILFFFVLAFPYLLSAQEDVAENDGPFMYSPGNPESVSFDLGIFRPVGIGNSAMAEAYAFTNPGFEFNFNWFVQHNFTIGASIENFNGTVEDKSKTGEISRTGISSLSINLGYYQVITREWYWHVMGGFGKVYYISKSAEDKFEEEGSQVYLKNQIGHRFTKTIAVYGCVNLRHDSLDIITSKELDGYFNSNLFLNFGIGLRINLQNEGG